MAAAVTSGVVALMVEANRETHEIALTPNAVKAILEVRGIASHFGRCPDARCGRFEWRWCRVAR